MSEELALDSLAGRAARWGFRHGLRLALDSGMGLWLDEDSVERSWILLDYKWAMGEEEHDEIQLKKKM